MGKKKGNWLPIHSFLQSARRVASQKNMKKPYLIYVATVNIVFFVNFFLLFFLKQLTSLIRILLML